ncbi:sugar phosphate isomerase/epimerase [archaeon]|jgi:hypothetical protein|nr:sugar phosphate isomerase/epimerase [archaeon]
MTSYESIYGGGDDTFMPKYNATGYQMEVRGIGMSTDPRTANQLGELNLRMNPGMKHIEVGAIQGDVMESIPEQHLDEIRRLAKMAGVKPSFHAPIIEASGVGERGWEEANRVGAEQQLKSAISRSHKVDPNGNISVTVHSTGSLPEMESKIIKEVIVDGKPKKVEEETGVWIINSKNGQTNFIPPQERFFPEEGKETFEGKQIKFDYDKELDKINEDTWSSELSGVNRYAEFGDQELRHAKSIIPNEELFSKIASGKINFNKLDEKEELEKQTLKQAHRNITSGQIYLRDSYKQMKNLFDNAWASKNISTKDKEKLRAFGEKIAPKIKPGMEKDPENINVLGEIIEEGLDVLGNLKETPQTYERLQPFIIKKSAETFANVAKDVYKEHGSTAPMINIENPPAGGGLSRAEDLKELIVKSRDQLTKDLTKEGMDKSKAKEVSEKMIGATWDVGHINMLRKKGYSEKDVIEQTKIIAPFVKHVHLSDNFGLDHTELPMGMGNVPIKEIMQKLGEKGFEGSKIIEAGNWWQHFAEKGGGNPFKPSLENFDSPIYSSGAGHTWSEMGSIPGYYSGHGMINPAKHHQIYGAGFEALPIELGGEMPGDQSRFSGAPNQ